MGKELNQAVKGLTRHILYLEKKREKRRGNIKLHENFKETRLIERWWMAVYAL